MYCGGVAHGVGERKVGGVEGGEERKGKERDMREIRESMASSVPDTAPPFLSKCAN